MTKDKNGITLVSLVITVIVMIIIFSVTIISATVLLDNTKLTNIQVGLYMARARAETLLEQYMFDNEKLSLVCFPGKLPEDNNSNSENTSEAIKEVFTVGYYGYAENQDDSGEMIGNSANNKTEEFNDIVTLVNKNTNEKKRLKYKYCLTEFDEIERTEGEKQNSKFLNMLAKIYPNYNEYYEVPVYDEITGAIKIDEDGNPITEKTPRYLFVKWGPEECVSQGIYKKTNSGEIDKDAIVNEDDYIIVCYDLKSGYVSVAYSKGYRKDDKLYYTLEALKNIDKSEEQDEEEEATENEG